MEKSFSQSSRTLSTPQIPNLKGHVSWSQIGMFLFALVLGVVLTLLFQNSASSEKISFSTLSLMGFLFSIALSAASIVLAIAAISLGKNSEKAMIDRSDESIRLQNDVFLKTTEALQRIEASTGVTEKRIEDIISGRAGDISQKLAEQLVHSSSLKGHDEKSLANDIRQSILDELSEERKKQRKEEQIRKKKEQEKALEEYQKFQDTILLFLTNEATTKALKIGDGSYTAEKEGLVDGLFDSSGKKFAICTFSTVDFFESQLLKGFDEFIRKIASEILDGTFDELFLVFDNPLDDDHKFMKLFKNTTRLMQPDIAGKLHVLGGKPDEISKKIIKIVSSKNDEKNHNQ